MTAERPPRCHCGARLTTVRGARRCVAVAYLQGAHLGEHRSPYGRGTRTGR